MLPVSCSATAPVGGVSKVAKLGPAVVDGLVAAVVDGLVAAVVVVLPLLPQAASKMPRAEVLARAYTRFDIITLFSSWKIGGWILTAVERL